MIGKRCTSRQDVSRNAGLGAAPSIGFISSIVEQPTVGDHRGPSHRHQRNWRRRAVELPDMSGSWNGHCIGIFGTLSISMKRLYAFTRDLHLYLGLFICPTVLVFAVSVFFLVHAWIPGASKQSVS